MTYLKYVDKINRFLLELLFPSFCLGCKKEGTYLCNDCKSTLEISQYHYCLCNKNPQRLPPGAKKETCSRCQDKALSGLYFALPYQEKFLTRKLIYQFKYEPHIRALAKTLAGVLAEHLIITQSNMDHTWTGSILVPVPMELKKLKNRGYNQAEQLARELSSIVKTPCIVDALVKIKKTPPQTKLSAKDRQKNVQGAFLIKKPGQIRGKKIFLVDDVYTTGATMEECAHILKAAGAKKVWGIAIAREG